MFFDLILRLYSFLLWIPLAISIYILAVTWKEYRKTNTIDLKKLFSKILIIITIFFGILAVTLLIRYEFYKLDDFAKYYLKPENGYFARIAGRQFLQIFYSLIAATLVAILFLIIKKTTRDRALTDAEIALGFLGGFLAGWQNSFYFLLSIFVLTVCGYILRKSPRGKITLYPYIIFSSFIWVIWQNYSLIILKRFFN